MNDSPGWRPAYTWPSDHFPFRLYFESEKIRVFIIENIPHNFNWLQSYATRIQARDFFVVLCGWHHSDWLASESKRALATLDLAKERFFFLYNSLEEKQSLQAAGFNGLLINQNAWIDENLVMKPLDIPKVYDAIYVARRAPFKRHMLAKEISSLALVAGSNHGESVSPIPESVYLNKNPLTSLEVCEVINQACCGLILSEVEGACYASSEYLLCGIPVVSTHSKGRRDV
jgi:hypothetical protein